MRTLWLLPLIGIFAIGCASRTPTRDSKELACRRETAQFMALDYGPMTEARQGEWRTRMTLCLQSK
jgi:hypothetical protein